MILLPSQVDVVPGVSFLAGRAHRVHVLVVVGPVVVCCRVPVVAVGQAVPVPGPVAAAAPVVRPVGSVGRAAVRQVLARPGPRSIRLARRFARHRPVEGGRP